MTPEGDLVAACLGLLAYCDVYAWRSNTGAVKAEYKGKTRFVRFGMPGMADILGVDRRGRFVAIECKVGKNMPTEIQQAFLRRVAEQGGVALVVYPHNYDTLIQEAFGR